MSVNCILNRTFCSVATQTLRPKGRVPKPCERRLLCSPVDPASATGQQCQKESDQIGRNADMQVEVHDHRYGFR